MRHLFCAFILSMSISCLMAADLVTSSEKPHNETITEASETTKDTLRVVEKLKVQGLDSLSGKQKDVNPLLLTPENNPKDKDLLLRKEENEPKKILVK